MPDIAAQRPRNADLRRSAALDGLRGYAAAAVVIYHTLLGGDSDLIASVLYRSVLDQTEPGRILLKVALSLFSGEAAVDIFFVISGIVLLRSLRPMLDRSGDGAWVAWAFLLRRVVRLWPVLAVVLAVHVASFAAIDQFWPGLIRPLTIDDLLSNLALWDFSVNGATWTLRCELIGAPLILLWSFAGRRFGVRAIPPAMLAAVALAWWVPSLRHDPALLTTLPFMVAGLAIESGSLAPVIRSLRGPVALAGGLAAALAIVATELFLPLGGGGAWRHLLGLLVSVTVFVAILEAEIPGPLTAVLLARPSQFLGRISFSLYLWNVPIFELLFGLLFAFGGPAVVHHHPIECGIILGVAAIGLALPIAAASERWLEQTSIRVGRALTRPPRRRRDTNTQTQREEVEPLPLASCPAAILNHLRAAPDIPNRVQRGLTDPKCRSPAAPRPSSPRSG